MSKTLEQQLGLVLGQYQESFNAKSYNEENDDHDHLMDAFGISPALKRENRQYWGRELGMCWQILVTQMCRTMCPKSFGPAIRYGQDEPCDLTVGKYAIDTKYRIGSGDSGTLKKFKSYGPLLRENGYEPVLLIVRSDNLDAAITACKAGTWKVLTGADTYKFLQDISGYDLEKFLIGSSGKFSVKR